MRGSMSNLTPITLTAVGVAFLRIGFIWLKTVCNERNALTIKLYTSEYKKSSQAAQRRSTAHENSKILQRHDIRLTPNPAPSGMAEGMKQAPPDV